MYKTLEELGIGRPSTYAPTISSIIDRRYVAKENKNLYMTELGEVVNNIMIAVLPKYCGCEFYSQYGKSVWTVWRKEKSEWKTIIENFYPDLEAAVKKAEEGTGRASRSRMK